MAILISVRNCELPFATLGFPSGSCWSNQNVPAFPRAGVEGVLEREKVARFKYILFLYFKYYLTIHHVVLTILFPKFSSLETLLQFSLAYRGKRAMTAIERLQSRSRLRWSAISMMRAVAITTIQVPPKSATYDSLGWSICQISALSVLTSHEGVPQKW